MIYANFLLSSMFGWFIAIKDMSWSSAKICCGVLSIVFPVFGALAFLPVVLVAAVHELKEAG